MSKNLDADLAKVMSAKKPQADKLEALREVVREHRDLQAALLEAEERAKLLRKQIWEMRSRTLPDLFQEANVDRVGIPAEGNYAAYDAVLQPYYHANIPKDNQEAAFTWLEDHGHVDLIKTTVKVELGLGERKLAQKVEQVLTELGVDYSRDLGVPWNTLTAWIKEQIEKYHETPPLSLFGATVATVVNLKERKNG